MNNKKKLKIAYKLSTLIKCDLLNVTRLSCEQMDYVYRGLREPTFLQACPGSGKTEVIGIKSAVEIIKWKNPNGGIALLTFTNSAAKELISRTSVYCKLKSGTHPHFIGTFDSWIHNFILHPFSHYMTGYQGNDGDKSLRIIESDTTAGFMNNYEVGIYRNGKMLPVMASEYYYRDDWPQIAGESGMVKNLIDNGLNDAEIKELQKNKVKFFKAGFATYSDAEFLCLKLLTKFPFLVSKLAERFPALIIDECQDLSEMQIKILDKLKGAGSNLDFVGDLNQAIYEFRDVDPKVLQSYVKDKHFRLLFLTNNFRSNQHIVDITSGLMSGTAKIKANVLPLANISCILWEYDQSDFSELPTKFENLVISNSLRLDHSAILARGKSTLDPLRLQHQKSKYGKIELLAIGLHCWCKADRSTDDVVNAINYTGKFLYQIAHAGRPDIRNQFCPEYLSPIHWRVLIKDFLNNAKILYPFEDKGMPIIWKTWCVLVKQFLKKSWHLCGPAQIDIDDAMKKIKSPNKMGDELVNGIYDYVPIRNNFRTTTIHSVKGETLDAVMLVSHKDKKSSGGHYSHWFRDVSSDDEHLRFAYVAFSRPRHFLVLAVPKLKQPDLTKLRAMGFEPN